MQDLPQDLKSAIEDHYYEGNGLFCPSGLSNGMIQICYIGITTLNKQESTDLRAFVDDLTKKIRFNTLSKTAEVDQKLGRVYLKIHYSEWSLIPDVLNCLAGNGFNYCIVCQWLLVNFDTGVKFTLAEFEKRLMSQVLDKFKQAFVDGTCDNFKIYTLRFSRDEKDKVHCPLMEFYNFSSQQGKQYCKILRDLFKVKDDEFRTDCFMKREQYIQTCKLYKVYEFGTWDAFESTGQDGKRVLGGVGVGVGDASQAQSNSNSNSACSCDPNSNSCTHKTSSVSSSSGVGTKRPIEDNPKKEDKCMVCLSAKPNTIVLPCGHQVVCFNCSKKLETGLNKDLCVKCRVKIDEMFLISE